MSDHWDVRREPEIASEEFLKDRRVEAPEGAAVELPGVDPGSVVALSRPFARVESNVLDAVLIEASRLFRRAESFLTDRLGPATSVVIDPESWSVSGLPEPVKKVAHCTLSLVSCWRLSETEWCLLEVHQGDQEQPVMVLLSLVPA